MYNYLARVSLFFTTQRMPLRFILIIFSFFLNLNNNKNFGAGLSLSIEDEVKILSRHSCLSLVGDSKALMLCGPTPQSSGWKPSDIRFGDLEINASGDSSTATQVSAVALSISLDRGIKGYFVRRNRTAGCLFEYQYFPVSGIPNSITIYHYGGETKTERYSVPAELIRQLNESGSSVFHLRTQDAFQDMHQSRQFTPAGHQLLADSMVSLVLFILDVQKRYPHVPLFYMGCSFGGLKGLLLSTILSNYTSFSETFHPPYDSLFRNAFRGIYQWPNLTGVICHAPAAKYLWENTVLKNFNVRIRMLILHSFDDERVPQSQSLKFIEKARHYKISPEHIWLHTIPQAAKSVKQLPENPHSTSLEGHFFPTHRVYNKEYWVTVKRFLNSRGRLSQIEIMLNEERLIHAKLAYDQFNADATPEAQERSWLYRLYFLLLKRKSSIRFKPKNLVRVQAQRFLDCFKMLAHSKDPKDEGDFSVSLAETITTHGPWLINRITDRQKVLLAGFYYTVGTLLLNKLRRTDFPSLRTLNKTFETGKIDEWFPLLSQQSHDIEINTLAIICSLVPEPVIKTTTLEGQSCIDLALENERSNEQLIRTLLTRELVPSSESLKAHKLPLKVFNKIFT